MPQTPEKYSWVKYAVLPILGALYPLVLPILERQYGIEDVKREAVKTEITNVIQSEETVESLSKKIEEHNKYLNEQVADFHKQFQEFNEMKESWKNSKAITLRIHNDGQITFTSFDGKEYDAYWNEREQVWKYIKNGKSYVIFDKED
jgi:hypothetical protein